MDNLQLVQISDSIYNGPNYFFSLILSIIGFFNNPIEELASIHHLQDQEINILPPVDLIESYNIRMANLNSTQSEPG